MITWSFRVCLITVSVTKAMRIEANLSANMWSKMFKSVDYLNNQIFRRALNWKTSFEVLTREKSNLSHLQSYECRAYSLKNIISRKNRLKLDWPQSWVSNMSNNSIRFKSRVEHDYLFDESNRIWSVVRRSNSTRIDCSKS